jgi:hypothetical protein
VLIAGHDAVTSPQSEIHLQNLGGAVAKQPAGGSAFPQRGAAMVLNVIGKWAGPVEGPQHIAWARELVQKMEPFGTGAAYINFLSDAEDPRRLIEAYGAETYTRLVAVKDRWDPENVFHLNQNIPPSAR